MVLFATYLDGHNTQSGRLDGELGSSHTVLERFVSFVSFSGLNESGMI